MAAKRARTAVIVWQGTANWLDRRARVVLVYRFTEDSPKPEPCLRVEELRTAAKGERAWVPLEPTKWADDERDTVIAHALAFAMAQLPSVYPAPPEELDPPQKKKRRMLTAAVEGSK